MYTKILDQEKKDNRKEAREYKNSPIYRVGSEITRTSRINKIEAFFLRLFIFTLFS